MSNSNIQCGKINKERRESKIQKDNNISKGSRPGGLLKILKENNTGGEKQHVGNWLDDKNQTKGT